MKLLLTKNDLEEKVEFTGVTGFRKSLLTIIPRLQKNQFLRFVITKHGRPAAVVLSYESYELLLKMAEELSDQDKKKSREQRLNEAYARMSKDHGTSASARPPKVARPAATVDTVEPQTAETVSPAVALPAHAPVGDWSADLLAPELEFEAEAAEPPLAAEGTAPIAESLFSDVVYSRLADEVVDRILKDPRLKQTRIASRQK